MNKTGEIWVTLEEDPYEKGVADRVLEEQHPILELAALVSWEIYGDEITGASVERWLLRDAETGEELPPPEPSAALDRLAELAEGMTVSEIQSRYEEELRDAAWRYDPALHPGYYRSMWRDRW